MKLRLRPLPAFVLGALVFVGVGLAARAASDAFSFQATAAHALLKGSLLAISLLLMALDGRGFRAFGFTRSKGARWGRVVASGLGLGALATALVLVTPAEGLPMVKEMSLLSIVVGVWLGSSLAEEVFTRGLVQTVIEPGAEARSILGLSQPVATSGLLFGALHLSIIFKGADPWTVAILVPATTALGLVAARFREATGSLWPAFVAHVAFNVGGGLAGIVYAVTQKLTEKLSA